MRSRAHRAQGAATSAEVHERVCLPANIGPAAGIAAEKASASGAGGSGGSGGGGNAGADGKPAGGAGATPGLREYRLFEASAARGEGLTPAVEWIVQSARAFALKRADAGKR
jgi:hypothetical protein